VHLVALFQQQAYGAPAAQLGIIGVGRKDEYGLVVDLHGYFNKAIISSA